MSSALSLQVAQLIREQRLLPRRTRAVVAVSGGLDSVLLLHLLQELTSDWGWVLQVAHCNHQLRGRASEADERFVQRLAERLGVPCAVGRAEVRQVATERGISLEMAARSCRHDFLARTAEAMGAGRVVLAHHGDDQVELFFLRLLRGAGLQGLQGMRSLSPSPSSPRIQLIRPLLGLTRAELLEEARRRRLRWREDASNRGLDAMRNRIRHQLLPRIRKGFQPGVTPVILRTMSILRDEADLGDRAMEAWGGRMGEGEWTSAPPAIQRRRVQEQLIAQGIPPEFDLIERLRRRPNVAWCLAPGRRILLDDQGQLRTAVRSGDPFLDARVGVVISGRRGRVHLGDQEVRWQVQQGGGDAAWRLRAGTAVEVFDGERVGDEILLRHWMPGDRFEPIGLGKRAKLQDLFVSAKIPRAERRKLLVGERADGSLFWVEGLRIGEACKVTTQTRRLLIWRWS